MPPALLPTGSDAWLISLGPLVAPAGSTLLLQLSYTAQFGAHKQGLWRSAPYPAQGAPPGSEIVALASEFETSAARAVLPCLDEPQYKVGGLEALVKKLEGVFWPCGKGVWRRQAGRQAG